MLYDGVAGGTTQCDTRSRSTFPTSWRVRAI